MNRLAAEAIGTFWLVFGGCGSAVLAAAFPQVGIGLLGVSFAFGLTVLTMAYAIGHISGCHLNPAVSVGLVVGKRFPASDLPGYIGAQVLGAVLGAGTLYLIASGKTGFDLGGFASNGYGEHSPGGYSLMAALLTEVVLTFMFLFIILGATDSRAPQGFAPIAIGLGLTRPRPLRGRLGDRTTLAFLDRPDHRCRIGRSRLSSDRRKPETIGLKFFRLRTRKGREQATAVSARLGHSEIRRSDRARSDRLWSEKTTEAGRDY